MTNPLTTVRKQHFWDWFSGDSVNARWRQRDVGGAGTFSMVDAVDEGFSVLTNTTSADHSMIDFNDKRQYEPTGSVMISIFRIVTLTSRVVQVGLGNDSTDPTVNAGDSAFINIGSGSFYALRSNDGVTRTSIDTSISNDTSFHNHKIECGSADIKETLDGVLEVTKTTNRPTIKLQPFLMAYNSTSQAEGRIRYCEAYNT